MALTLSFEEEVPYAELERNQGLLPVLSGTVFYKGEESNLPLLVDSGCTSTIFPADFGKDILDIDFTQLNLLNGSTLGGNYSYWIVDNITLVIQEKFKICGSFRFAESLNGRSYGIMGLGNGFDNIAIAFLHRRGSIQIAGEDYICSGYYSNLQDRGFQYRGQR